MNKIYFLLFILLSFGSYAQDSFAYENLKKDEITGFKLYPNPATSDIVYITTSKNQTKDIKIYNVFGELVHSARIRNKILNIAKLAPGVYVVQVTENGKSITRKLIIK